ncbi:tyrosine-type recombinase/integrase [Methylorubrum thiocyanatum]|uniref:Core-binding (CB) domain-containing protein n=1 Tax=Methylorubrum thiocyanatum TaxID=47958 RepID=A0AA40S7X5_9HYPH|nr:integrase arm-type DNA-binding domain-containing protein [Methylorubrum thiocyanatum]MBA8916241.1 hypothetical protein [Methylorubrum thiocyanatum]GJE83874.1 hypothetical protein CJNNKLLH_5253 [Methylorubrum thiocyanatum]
MARAINRLSARTVQTLTEPGRHADGDGLYLVVDENGGKRWVYLFRFAGKRREMGLGPLRMVSLAQARELAGKARTMAAQGLDPVAARQAALPSPEPAPQTAPTFAAIADAFMDDRAGEWRNAKHRQQWRNTLTTYAANLWTVPVSDIGTQEVLAALRPIWREKPETASRVRGRIERVLDAAKVEGHRDGENPARWRGHLEHTLPKAAKLSRGHHPALPYRDVPAFVAALRSRVADSALDRNSAVHRDRFALYPPCCCFGPTAHGAEDGAFRLQEAEVAVAVRCGAVDVQQAKVERLLGPKSLHVALRHACIRKRHSRREPLLSEPVAVALFLDATRLVRAKADNAGPAFIAEHLVHQHVEASDLHLDGA